MVSSPYDTDRSTRNQENTHSNYRVSPRHLGPEEFNLQGRNMMYRSNTSYNNNNISTAIMPNGNPPPNSRINDIYGQPVDMPLWSPSNQNQDFPQLRQGNSMAPLISQSLVSPPTQSLQPIQPVQRLPRSASGMNSMITEPCQQRPYDNVGIENNDINSRYSFEQHFFPTYVVPPYQLRSRNISQLYEPADSRDGRWSEQVNINDTGNIDLVNRTSSVNEEKIDQIQVHPLTTDPRNMEDLNNNFSVPNYADYDRPPSTTLPVSINELNSETGLSSRPHSTLVNEAYEPGYKSQRRTSSKVTPLSLPYTSTSEPSSSRLCGMGEISTSVDQAGVPWLEFQYPREGAKHRYHVRCDIDDLDVNRMDIQFRVDNCIYPGAMAPPEEYRGHRRNYETECNLIGWRLVYKNPILQNKRGLIQRAVDTYRNSSRNVSIRSRRARRMAKLHRLKENNKTRQTPSKKLDY